MKTWEAPGMVMILSQEIRIFDKRTVLQIVSSFALAAKTQFFLVKNRIAISVSPPTVLRRRG
jgi:hypothetical protein